MPMRLPDCPDCKGTGKADPPTGLGTCQTCYGRCVAFPAYFKQLNREEREYFYTLASAQVQADHLRRALKPLDFRILDCSIVIEGFERKYDNAATETATEPRRIRCHSCKMSSPLPSGFECPRCGSFCTELA